jgi:hypothetical protein
VILLENDWIGGFADEINSESIEKQHHWNR